MSDDKNISPLPPTDHQLEEQVTTENHQPMVPVAPELQAQPSSDIESSQAPAVAVAKPNRKVTPAAIWLSLVSFVLAVLAWVEMIFNEYASGSLAIAGLVVAIVGCCLCRRCIWRDISITSIIATGMLLIVFAIFFFGIRYAINAI
ncbi:MAG: hypothetical protein LIP09_04615 [Bacteroidales bacterium]|nr:hypothetical protein [Bacteroidales bacterium]